MISTSSELEILNKKDVFFFDLDGTMYLGDELFDGVLDVINILKQKPGKRFFFFSNNSSKSTADYLKKLNRLNLDVSVDNIILSQHPTIHYLQEEGYRDIFLMGTTSLKKEFKRKGFHLTEE